MADDYYDRIRDQARYDQMRDLQRQGQIRQDQRREDERRREEEERDQERFWSLFRLQQQTPETPSWPRETAGRQPPSIAPLGNSSMGLTLLASCKSRERLVSC
jgi:hypothetical protein